MPRSAWGLEVDPAHDVDWRQHAACDPHTAELFWITTGHGPTVLSKDNRAALELCRACPVRTPCERHERRERTQYAHIAAGLVWTVDGPREVYEVGRHGR